MWRSGVPFPQVSPRRAGARPGPTALAVLAVACGHHDHRPHPLVGLSSPDWLLDPPAGFSPRGERVLGDGPEDGRWGLVLGAAGGRQLVVLDRAVDVPPAVVFVVDAVLELPRGTAPLGVAWDCRLAGRDDPFVVGTVAPASGCDLPDVPAVAAWRVIPSERRFDPLPPADVRCAPIACEGGPMELLEAGTAGQP